MWCQQGVMRLLLPSLLKPRKRCHGNPPVAKIWPNEANCIYKATCQNLLKSGRYSRRFWKFLEHYGVSRWLMWSTWTLLTTLTGLQMNLKNIRQDLLKPKMGQANWASDPFTVVAMKAGRCYSFRVRQLSCENLVISKLLFSESWWIYGFLRSQASLHHA